MPIAVDITRFGNEFVIHFGGEGHQVNAVTYARTLLNISAALKEINSFVSPEIDIEIVVDAIGPGSFRSRIRPISKSAGKLWQMGAKEIVTGILLYIILQHMPAEPQKQDTPQTKIEAKDSTVIVNSGIMQITIPREAYDAAQKVQQKTAVNEKVAKTFEALRDDSSVTEFGITESLEDPEPTIVVPRESFEHLCVAPLRQEILETERLIVERTKLVVIRPVLERGKRKWQFAWSGIVISAPILDQSFFDRMERREISFAQGDELDVIMKIKQERDGVSGAWLNKEYEIELVHAHMAPPKQQALLPDAPSREIPKDDRAAREAP